MLMTVLKGGLAIQQSKALMRTFKRSDDLHNGLRANLFADFCKEYPGLHITLKKSGGIFHDRFIVLDYGTEWCRVFLCGASSKDAGVRITTITEILTVQMYDAMVSNLINNANLQLK